MDIRRSLGLKVSILRNAKELTQEEFANKINVSRGLISKIENGTIVPSCEVIRNIGKEFNVSSDWLLDLNTTMLNSDTLKLIYIFNQFDNEKRNNILIFLESMLK
ncbi:helix-turn-helix domain-containing protein [Clostridium ihumii]|uniref:helix-turn-helix domain-containing protein n=1 Tax=Clostridium ihumii TaxID=1470356 RepID=UPI00058B9E2D|nr:helix-turn-helix transcriptional regulator [Clostridium ihumii]